MPPRLSETAATSRTNFPCYSFLADRQSTIRAKPGSSNATVTHGAVSRLSESATLHPCRAMLPPRPSKPTPFPVAAPHPPPPYCPTLLATVQISRAFTCKSLATAHVPINSSTRFFYSSTASPYHPVFPLLHCVVSQCPRQSMTGLAATHRQVKQGWGTGSHSQAVHTDFHVPGYRIALP